MLSNSRRPLKMIAVLILVALAMLYGQMNYNTRPETFEYCLSHSEECEGREVNSCVGALIKEITPDGFLLQCAAGDFAVKGDFEGLVQNEYITGKMVFHRDYLEFSSLHVHVSRRLKIYLSLIPAFIVLAYLFYVYRFDLRGFVFIERRNRTEKETRTEMELNRKEKEDRHA